jgi:hypothetical protein
MLDPIQTLEDRVSELLHLLRQTVKERDGLRTRLNTLEAELVESKSENEESGPLAELEKQRLQALEVVESALAELGHNQSAA